MALWVGTQGQAKLAKNSKTPHPYDVTSRKPKRKTKNFFSIRIRRLVESVEGFSSSFAQSVGEL